MADTSAVDTLAALIAGNEALLARLAAPLWARVGRPLSPADLDWTRAFGWEGAPTILWQALEEAGALQGRSWVLRAAPLAQFLTDLAGTGPAAGSRVSTSQSDSTDQELPRLLWTLPSAHKSIALHGGTYLQALNSLLTEAQEQAVLVSPYIEARGVGLLFSYLVQALAHQVHILLLTHDATNGASPTSRALEELRREAERVRGHLSVYSADAGSGRDRVQHPLLHAKLLVVDRRRLILGSANLTSYALSSNFEAGVMLGQAAARQATDVITGLIATNLVYPVFTVRREV